MQSIKKNHHVLRIIHGIVPLDNVHNGKLALIINANSLIHWEISL